MASNVVANLTSGMIAQETNSFIGFGGGESPSSPTTEGKDKAASSFKGSGSGGT